MQILVRMKSISNKTTSHFILRKSIKCIKILALQFYPSYSFKLCGSSLQEAIFGKIETVHFKGYKYQRDSSSYV